MTVPPGNVRVPNVGFILGVRRRIRARNVETLAGNVLPHVDVDDFKERVYVTPFVI